MINFGKYFLLFFFLLAFKIADSQRLELFNNDVKIKTKKFHSQISLENYLSDYQQKFIRKGYLTASFDSIKIDSLSKITFAYFSAGKKFYWGKIQTKSDSENNPQYFKENYLFKINQKEKKIDNIIKNYANIGYPFVSVKLDSLKIGNNHFSGNLNIEKGNKIIFDSIIIKGDSKIRPYYINKILNIKRNEKFSLKKTDQISKNIKNTTFLIEERPFEISFSDSTCDISLYLKKRKSSNFSGMLGILPNNKTTGKVLLTGEINLYLLNILNFGELFSLNWQKFETANQFLNLEFNFPYLFKTNFGIGALFAIEKVDTICLKTDFTGKILYGNTFGTSFDIFYRNISSFLLIDSLVSSNLNYSNNNSNMFGLSFRFSNLDNVFNPQRGISLYINCANGLKTYEDNSKEIFNNKESLFKNQSMLEIIGFIPIGRNFAIKMRNQTGILYSKKIFNNELYQIGGMNSIRGFDEKSFFASNYSFVNFEFRYLFDEYSCVYTLYDIGYFEQRFTAEYLSNYVMGIGVGLDLRTVAGIFSVAAAVGKQNENPFIFKNYKIHLGYKTYF
ncbi:MAG: BamA/TamA family outer membrane protein [Bacteroidales bacterium]|jgi:outer membrane protein assembly factor BamA|nr:BamA/TamA family outer membrane protein [Bacteroidales bacterium]